MTLRARVISAPQSVIVPEIAPLVTTKAGLRALQGGPTNPSAVLHDGRKSGLFVWDTSVAADDRGTRLNAGGPASSSAGWKRIFDGPLRAEWFAESSDTDDTESVLAAVAVAVTGSAGSRTVELDTREYVLSESIVLEYLSGGDGTNVTLRGANATRDIVAVEGSTLTWNGNGADPMVKMLSRGCLIEGITFRIANGKTCAAAITLDQGSGGVGTHCVVRSCQIFSPTQDFTNGIVIGPTSGVFNLEFNDFEDLDINGCSNACILIAADTGQSKQNKFTRVSMLTAAYGIYTVWGSFNCYSVSARDLGEVFHLGNPTDVVGIHGLDVEFCQRVLFRGVSSDTWRVHIDSARIDLGDDVPEDSPGIRGWIAMACPGPLLLTNVYVGFAGNTIDPAELKIMMQSYSGANGDGSITAINCVFQSDTPFYSVSGGDNYLTMLGCKRITNAASAHVRLPDCIAELIENSTPAGTGASTLAGLAMGVTPASAGIIRIPNDEGLTARDTGDTADIQLIGLDSNDDIKIGGSTEGKIILGSGADMQWGKALVTLGGGAAPTLGTIGGSGPGTAAQHSWMRVLDSSGNAFWVPVWK